MCFSVHSSVVHLQKANAEFHKIGYIYYSGEAEKFTFLYNKINQGTICIKFLSQSVRFCRLHIKTFWCVFRFTVLTAVHLQNENAKFHKIGYRYYSGEAEKYTFLYNKFTQ